MAFDLARYQADVGKGRILRFRNSTVMSQNIRGRDALEKLPTYITEARGFGVACVIAVQSSSQMVLRWRQDGAKVLRNVFPAVLILRGAPERELLENAVWWDGEGDVWRESIDSKQQKSLSAERAPRTTATSLLPTKIGEGLLLLNGQAGLLVDLPGIWEFGPKPKPGA